MKNIIIAITITILIIYNEKKNQLNKPQLTINTTEQGQQTKLMLEFATLTQTTLMSKRVLEYGVQAPVFYGNLREQTGENGFPRIPTGSLFCSYRDLRKLPGIHRRT